MGEAGAPPSSSPRVFTPLASASPRPAAAKESDKPWLLPLGTHEGTVAPARALSVSTLPLVSPGSRCTDPPPLPGSPAPPARISGGEDRQVAKYNGHTHHPLPCPTGHTPVRVPGPDSCTERQRPAHAAGFTRGQSPLATENAPHGDLRWGSGGPAGGLRTQPLSAIPLACLLSVLLTELSLSLMKETGATPFS